METHPPQSAVGPDQPVASFLNVHKTYPGARRPALSGFSLHVHPGEIVVVVGPNGSGKTTALEMLPGLRRPSSGTVSVAGIRVRGPGAQRLVLGVQLQEAGLPVRIKVREAFAAVECLYRDPGPVDDIRAALGLEPYMGELVEKLSGGWRRRLDVALACIGRPRMLVLDEPTSGLDPVARAEQWAFLRGLRAQGVGVLASTHDLSEAESFADRLVILHQGRVALSGSVDDVLAAAGGTWRVRVVGDGDGDGDGDETLHLLAARHQLVFLPTSDGHTAIGNRDAVMALTGDLEAARDDGSVSVTDLIRGPVRLEDVFAHTTAQGDPS